MISTDYTKQAEEFLAAHQLTFTATLVGNDCPQFCDDHAKGIDLDKLNTFPRRTHIHGKHYSCTIERQVAHCKGGNCAHYQEKFCGCRCDGCKPANVTFDFWNSYSDEEQNYMTVGGRNWPSISSEDWRMVEKYKSKCPVKVRAYDVLACIQHDDPGDFEEFCSNYGYNTDSRKAEDTWRAVVKEWQKVKRFFTAEELEQLQEIR